MNDDVGARNDEEDHNISNQGVFHVQFSPGKMVGDLSFPQKYTLHSFLIDNNIQVMMSTRFNRLNHTMRDVCSTKITYHISIAFP